MQSKNWTKMIPGSLVKSEQETDRIQTVTSDEQTRMRESHRKMASQCQPASGWDKAYHK